MVLTKIQKSQQDEQLKVLKNTYPDLTIIDYEEYGRLWKPDIFKYSNKARLYKEVTKKILRFFYYFHYAFSRLPDSYKREILEGGDFKSFINNQVFQFAYTVDKKQKADRPEDIFSYSLYLNFFSIGINGLIKTMPSEFQNHLTNEINPSLDLMQSLVNYSKRINPKSKIPSIPKKFPKRNKNHVDKAS